MGDLDSEMTISPSKSSLDSGFDHGFLSDSSSSSNKSDSCSQTSPSKCLFEENMKGKRYSKQSYHHCALNLYRKSGRCIETVSPRTFLYLANCVRVLDLSKNKIKTLPETISELIHLQELNLSCNELLNVPDSCKKLEKLQVLNLSQNKLTEPPLCLELGMERLTQLDLSGNKISQFPNPPKCSCSLRVLDLSHNCFIMLPLWLFSEQCRSLLELDVSFNFCFDNPSLQSQLPLMKHHRTSVLKSLRKLRICNTGSNQRIISPLSCFESLQSLHMGNVLESDSTLNYFTEFKVNFLYNPSNIVELHLPKIGLAGLPVDICKFVNLEFLDASHNPLDWLPETFGFLKSLRELVIPDCNLSYLPENFKQLKRLKKLIIYHNKLTDVRESLSGLCSLEMLDIYDNYLEDLPVAPVHLLSLHMVDMAYNYVNLEEALDVEVNGERAFDIYCRQQARMREAHVSHQLRTVAVKVNNSYPSWSSLESLHKSYRSESYSDISDQNHQTRSYFNDEIEDAEDENWDENSGNDENWDEYTGNEDDEFEPDSVYRYSLPLGLYHFGWTPPIKMKECHIPINQQVSGFVFIPGQLHQKTTIRKRRRKIKDLPVSEGQFDDTFVDQTADLQKAELLGELLRKMYMFIRNPAGMRSKRRCKFHSIYEDCLHHGLWYRLSPPVCFECPDDSFEEDEDI